MDILDTFIGNAQKSISEGYYDAAAIQGARGPKLSLRKTLSDRPFSLIAEIKHASPAGEYSFNHIDVEATARTFRECGADAISVVVEPRLFHGNLSHVPLVKRAGLPVLFKDFIFTSEQILAAKAVGADALLLVVKVVDRLGLDLETLVSKAHREGLEVLLESYDEEEMRRAMRTDSDILGINNRDLQTLKVDLTRTVRVLSSVGTIDRPVISESGISTASDASFARRAGVNGVLVGTAIWRAPDLREKIRELKGAVTTMSPSPNMPFGRRRV